jgi:uncharacterized Zn finger protein
MPNKQFWDFISAAQRLEKAEQNLSKSLKKRPELVPVLLEGKALAHTWWGKSWNKNLERYADYRNRIGRGKAYVRRGMVLDLRIDSGKVTALVQGTRAKPYLVEIAIAPIKKTNWTFIKKQCQGELHSLADLLAGTFPRKLGDMLLSEGRGLFPTPREIRFTCSCPDWASMCKHVAATLYGIGARLDTEPDLLFVLRQAKTEELVSQAVRGTTSALLRAAQHKGSRVLEDADLTGLFGIDLETPRAGAKTETAAPCATPKPTTPSAGSGPSTLPATDLVERIVRRHRKGITVAKLVEKTGFPRKKIYAITSKLRQQDRIRYIDQGVYGPP